eukprot:gene9269-19241_t
MMHSKLPKEKSSFKPTVAIDAQMKPTNIIQEKIFAFLNGEDQVITGITENISSVCWHPLRNIAALSFGGGSVYIFTMQKWLQPFNHDFQNPSIYCMVWNPLLNHLYVGTNTGICVWSIPLDFQAEIETPKMRFLKHPLNCPIHNISICPLGRFLITFSNKDKAVYIWDIILNDSNPLYCLDSSYAKSLSWSPSGSHILIGTSKNEISIIETYSWKFESYLQLDSFISNITWLDSSTAIFITEDSNSDSISSEPKNLHAITMSPKEDSTDILQYSKISLTLTTAIRNEILSSLYNDILDLNNNNTDYSISITNIASHLEHNLIACSFKIIQSQCRNTNILESEHSDPNSTYTMSTSMSSSTSTSSIFDIYTSKLLEVLRYFNIINKEAFTAFTAASTTTSSTSKQIEIEMKKHDMKVAPVIAVFVCSSKPTVSLTLKRLIYPPVLKKIECKTPTSTSNISLIENSTSIIPLQFSFTSMNANTMNNLEESSHIPSSAKINEKFTNESNNNNMKSMLGILWSDETFSIEEA